MGVIPGQGGVVSTGAVTGGLVSLVKEFEFHPKPNEEPPGPLAKGMTRCCLHFCKVPLAAQRQQSSWGQGSSVLSPGGGRGSPAAR